MRFGRILTIDSWVLWFCQDSVESCGILKIRQIFVLRFGRITVFRLLIPEYCDFAKIPSNLAESWRFGRFSYWDSTESWLLILLRFRWILTISFTMISLNFDYWFCKDSVESCGILKIRLILVLRFGRITVFRLLIPEY